MAKLLCALSSSRAIHFYDVVPLGLLLDAMSQDSPSVSTRIQSILVPSYFPNPEEGSARVAMLLKANPAAGQAFCGYLVSSWVASGAGVGGFRASVPIEHVLQLTVDLKGHLLATAEAVSKVLREREEAAAAETRGRKKQKKAGGKAGAKGGKAAKQPATGKRRKAAKPAGIMVKSEDGGKAGVNAEQEEGEEDEEEAVSGVRWVHLCSRRAKGWYGKLAQHRWRHEHGRNWAQKRTHGPLWIYHESSQFLETHVLSRAAMHPTTNTRTS